MSVLPPQQRRHMASRACLCRAGFFAMPLTDRRRGFCGDQCERCASSRPRSPCCDRVGSHPMTGSRRSRASSSRAACIRAVWSGPPHRRRDSARLFFRRIRLSTRVTILAGSGKFGTSAGGEPERNANDDRGDLQPQQLVETKQPGQPLAAAEEQILLLTTDADYADDGAPASSAVRTYPCGHRSRPCWRPWWAGTRRSPHRGTRSSSRPPAAWQWRFPAGRRKPARRRTCFPPAIGGPSSARTSRGRSAPEWS